MKCQVTQNLHVHDQWDSPLITMIDGRRRVAAGTVIDQSEHPETDCVRLVRNGEAIPLDDECRKACGMTVEQIDAAQAAQDRLQALLRTEDNANDTDA